MKEWPYSSKLSLVSSTPVSGYLSRDLNGDGGNVDGGKDDGRKVGREDGWGQNGA
jgi:hypothetical protein